MSDPLKNKEFVPARGSGRSSDIVSKPSGILIASHPRSGTHLLIDVLRRQFTETQGWRWWGQPLDYLYFNIERSTSVKRHFDEKRRRTILSRAKIPIMKTHYLADFSETWVEDETAPLPKDVAKAIDRAAVIYVHRDPRDVMVSYKQFVSALRTDAAAMGLTEFMRARHWSGGSHLDWWEKHVTGWLAKPRVTPIAYRDLINSPEKTVRKLGRAIECEPSLVDPVLPGKVTSITKTRMDRLFSLSPSSTGIIADRSQFPSTPWRHTMTAEDHAWFENRLGGLLDWLGYPRLAKGA